MATQPTKQKRTPDPHDTYVKKVFRQIPQARAFFRAYLPDDVQALFDWRTLRVESVNFISDELQRRFADLRFTVRLIGDTVDRRITLLFDHKRRTDYTTLAEGEEGGGEQVVSGQFSVDSRKWAAERRVQKSTSHQFEKPTAAYSQSLLHL